MGLLQKNINVRVSVKMAEYYKQLGYTIPTKTDAKGIERYDIKNYFNVDVDDLPCGSSVSVKVECDRCKKTYSMRYKTYLKHKHGEKIYCNSCSKALFNSGKNNPNFGGKYSPKGEKSYNYGGKYSKRGKDNPLWDPNITDEERKTKRNYPEYVEFIKKVLIRDNFTCQCCGLHNSKNMRVHHLNGYNWCKEQRTDETNGITLCETCHKNFHSKYGTKNNTKEQFEKWIGHAIIELGKYNGKLPTARKVYCIEENKIYNSIKELAHEWGCNETSARDACNHRRGIKSLYKKHLMWIEDAIKNNYII